MRSPRRFEFLLLPHILFPRRPGRQVTLVSSDGKEFEVGELEAGRAAQQPLASRHIYLFVYLFICLCICLFVCLAPGWTPHKERERC